MIGNQKIIENNDFQTGVVFLENSVQKLCADVQPELVTISFSSENWSNKNFGTPFMWPVHLSDIPGVKVYGTCGPYKCSDKAACWDMVGHQFKFYLSLENSICKVLQGASTVVLSSFIIRFNLENNKCSERSVEV